VDRLVALSALLVAGVNAGVAGLGAWRWWRVEASRAFWPLLRVAQGLAVAYVVLVAVLAAEGHRPDDGLFWLYALLPVAVGFIGEALRAASAQTVLDARGLADAPAVGELPEAGQRSVVLAIVRRELGVMTVAAAVVVFLALRAASTAGGF
jgi:hypothetical protein